MTESENKIVYKSFHSFLNEATSAVHQSGNADSVSVLYHLAMDDREGNTRYVEPSGIVRGTLRHSLEAICFRQNDPGWFSKDRQRFDTVYQLIESMIVNALPEGEKKENPITQ